MKSRLHLHWLAALAVASVLTIPAKALAQGCNQLIASGNPEYVPFLWRDPVDDSRLVGANLELLQWLGKEIGIPIELRYVGPWARVQEEVRHGKVDMIAGAFYTQARLEYMDYFYPAFQAARTVVWTRSQGSFSFREWKDLKGKKGLVVINNSVGEEFDRYTKNELDVHAVPTLDQALRMLQLGRADYLVYEENPALAVAARAGIAGLKSSATAISNENLYLTLSHKSACNTGEVRGRISKALAKLQKENAMRKMIENALREWHKQVPPAAKP